MGRKVHVKVIESSDGRRFSETKDSGCVLSLPGPLGPGAYLNLGGPFSFGTDKPLQ